MKKKLKIGDVAKELGIKKSIIRQWEQEFGLKENDSELENNRYYTSEDIHLFTTIKNLLRTQGLSISDAKAHLKTTVPAIKYIESAEEKLPPMTSFQSQPQEEEPIIDASPLDSTIESLPEPLDATPQESSMKTLENENEHVEQVLSASTTETEETSALLNPLHTHEVEQKPTISSEENRENLLHHEQEKSLHSSKEEPSLKPAENLNTLELHLAELKERLLYFKKLLS